MSKCFVNKAILCKPLKRKNYEFLTFYAFGLCLPMENEILTDRLEMQS